MHLAIDGRMYSKTFGIGRFLYENLQIILKQKQDWKITLFLPSTQIKEFSFSHPDLTIIPADEKIYSLGEQTTFLKKLNNTNADLTWFPHFNVPFFYNKNFVVTVHDLTISRYPGKKSNPLKQKIYFLILRNAIKKAKKIFTVSQNTKKDLINDEGVEKEKIYITLNAVGKEFTHFAPNASFDPKKFGIQKPFFYYSGAFREHKNIIGLVKAFHQFIKNNGNIAQLVISGKPDPLYPESVDYISEHNLEEDIKLVGLLSVSDLINMYAAATVYVFPSFYEGFGLPPLEAMAVGTPVISSNTSSLPEVCSDAALLFNPHNTDEITSTMEKVFLDKNLQKTLIQKGKENIKKFSWEKSADILLQEIDNLFKKKV